MKPFDSIQQGYSKGDAVAKEERAALIKPGNRTFKQNVTISKSRVGSRTSKTSEESVSLIGLNGKPTPSPEKRRPRKMNPSVPWTFTRLIKYLTLTAASALLTFVAMGRQTRVVHWEEYHNLLDPELKTGHRCFANDDWGQNERCTCPDPTKPLERYEKPWKAHHKMMVKDAQSAPENLDVVFLGDSMVERWNGTASLGRNVIPEMRNVFEERFTRKGGGALEGIALGSAGDTGPNLLWHIENGLIEDLDPKLWLIVIGSNDLYMSKCTDRFVKADILNVVKKIDELKPNSQFIIHAILPRLDNPKSKSHLRGKLWNYALTVNADVRKFCKDNPRFHSVGAENIFTKPEERGRRPIDMELMDDGIHPTIKGLELWGDYLVKKIGEILAVNVTERMSSGFGNEE